MGQKQRTQDAMRRYFTVHGQLVFDSRRHLPRVTAIDLPLFNKLRLQLTSTDKRYPANDKNTEKRNHIKNCSDIALMHGGEGAHGKWSN